MEQKFQFKNNGFPLNFQGMDFITCLSQASIAKQIIQAFGYSFQLVSLKKRVKGIAIFYAFNSNEFSKRNMVIVLSYCQYLFLPFFCGKRTFPIQNTSKQQLNTYQSYIWNSLLIINRLYTVSFPARILPTYPTRSTSILVAISNS